MGKGVGYIFAVVAGLLLIFLFKRRRNEGMYDNFFSDAEIIRDYEEPPEPTAVPAALMPSQVDDGNKNTECEQGGYMAFTFPNPTANPITLNIVNPSEYYQSLIDFYASQSGVANDYTVGGSLTATLEANGLYYCMDRGSSAVKIFNPVSGSLVSNIPLAPNLINVLDANNGESSIISGNLLIIPGLRYVTFIDIDPNSGTYNQVIANTDCGAGWKLNTCSIFGGFVYVMALNGALSGYKKIDLSTFINTISNQFPSVCTANPAFPNSKFGQTSAQYLYLFDNVLSSCRVYDTFTDTPIGTFTLSGPTTGQPCIAGTDIYVPQANNVDIFDTGSNSVTGSIPITFTALFSLFNGNDTIYLSGVTGITALQVSTSTIINTIATGFLSEVIIISNNLLYASNSLGVSNIAIIDTDENSATYNTITSTISGTTTALNNPIAITTPSLNVLFTSVGGSTVTTISTVTTNVLNSQIGVNLSNMANMQANPGMICGIFYRCLTVAQMNNVLSIDYQEVTGNGNTYKLIPITYKDTMSVLNQIYVSKFFKPIIINNNLNLYHVINPGENVYLKIYVKNYVSNVELLKTGKIGVSETKNTSVFKGGYGMNEEDESEGDDDDEGWMTVDEVEAGEWNVIHIQCPEEDDENEDESQQ